MEIIRVGLDLAKNVFQVHGVDAHDKPVWKRSLRRGQWLHELQRRVAPECEIGMEACAGAHTLGPPITGVRLSSKADDAAVRKAVHRVRAELLKH